MASRSDCLSCSKTVTSRQHAIQCDRCSLWQHRLCNSGVSFQDYKLAFKGELGSEIVDKILAQVNRHATNEASSKHANLIRTANRRRQKTRPKHPDTLDFTLQDEHIPEGFFRSDVVVKDRRHLVFASQEMVDLLTKAKTWYIDGTFKVVKAPFTQLLSIHAFVKANDEIKQVPLMFVLMSGRKKRDYKGVFKAVKNLLPSISVKSMMIDFEAAIWAALRSVFPGIDIRGCCYHFTQAVWRKIQEIGLSVAYKNDDGTNRFCRRLLALPLIPHEHIPLMFSKIKDDANTPALEQLCAYINDTWINST